MKNILFKTLFIIIISLVFCAKNEAKKKELKFCTWTTNQEAKAEDKVEANQEGKLKINKDKKVSVLIICSLILLLPAAILLPLGIISKNLIILIIGLILFIAAVVLILIELFQKLQKKRK